MNGLVTSPPGLLSANREGKTCLRNHKAWIWLLFLALAVLAACSPPQTPEQLSFTPGAPITITDDVYITSAFSTRYPPGWRVITPPAEAPPGAIFAAPDNTALIMLSINPIGTPPELANVPAERVTVEGDEVALGEITVYAALVADRESIDTMRDDFAFVLDSIKGN